MQKFEKSTGLLAVNKYLPHNFLAEKIILSSLLINIEAIELILRTVKIETFYFKNHQQLYKTIIEMYKKKLPVDIITLHSFLQDNGLLETIGGGIAGGLGAVFFAIVSIVLFFAPELFGKKNVPR